MILFWCLCVSLLFVALTTHRHVRAAVTDLWLHLFGVRVRASSPSRRSPQGKERRQVTNWPFPPSRSSFWPPPQVTTRILPREGP